MPLTTIAPIETIYNGYRFRSRLEARWAVFFDTLGIGYEYEKEGYDLGKAGWYLPDFWLPERHDWIEIKGAAPSEDEIAKCKALALATMHFVYLFIGLPRYDGVEYPYAIPGATYWPIVCDEKMAKHSLEYPEDFGGIAKVRQRIADGGEVVALANDHMYPPFGATPEAYIEACHAARSARFERGK